MENAAQMTLAVNDLFRVVCTENLFRRKPHPFCIRFDLMTESLNVGHDGRTDILPLESGCLELQAQEAT